MDDFENVTVDYGYGGYGGYGYDHYYDYGAYGDYGDFLTYGFPEDVAAAHINTYVNK